MLRIAVVVAAIFVAAFGCLLVNASSICLDDSTLIGGGEEGDSEHAPVLLVGRYKMKVDSANEQVSVNLTTSSRISSHQNTFFSMN